MNVHARKGALYPRSGQFDRVLQVLREAVVPAARQQPGYDGMILLENRQAGKIVTITMWESRVEMLASQRGEYVQEQVSRLITLLSKPPEIEDYGIEVL